MENAAHSEVAIVGGGLAGLAVASYLARAGRSVVLFEKAAVPGGRAVTHRRDGYAWNIGPHALYVGGAGVGVLGELEVAFSAAKPSRSGGVAIKDGQCSRLPSGLPSLLMTRLLSMGAKFEFARALQGIGKLDGGRFSGVSVAEWLERNYQHQSVRDIIAALVRLTSYCNSPSRMCASAAIDQLQMALSKNVYYIDHGWQTLVDGLAMAAASAGARIMCSQRIVSLESTAGGFVVSSDSEAWAADAVILATTPRAALALAGLNDHGPLSRFAKSVVPVRAACLDLALSALPYKRVTFALGIDVPLYFSVHSVVADVAPSGAATIHVAKYLDGDQPRDTHGDEEQLEEMMDLVQPGWREVAVERRYLPSIKVCEAMPQAEYGGIAGRPSPLLPSLEGSFIAGDWVGARGLLADAALASAKEAAMSCLEFLARGHAH